MAEWEEKAVGCGGSGEKAEEEEDERLLQGVTVMDFDVLCSTVAQGNWRKLQDDDDVDGGGEFGGVLRMWEGEVLDFFDDRRVALQSAWYVS